MNPIVVAKDLLSLTRQVIASAVTDMTAGGTGDNTAVTGLAIDRGANGWPQSMIFAWIWQATLGASATLTIGTLVIQDSADGSNWATYVPPAPVAAPAAPGVVGTGSATLRGVARINVNLTAARQFVRINWTPDLSAANTDTARVVALATLVGQDRLPA